MAIRQFNLRFDPEQDRILFRLNTIHREEFRFSLTRRYVRLLGPVLKGLLEEEFKNRNPENMHLAGDLVSFEHQGAVSQADFGQAFDERVQQYPLGEEYLLLTGARVKRKEGGAFLCLHPSRGHGIELKANSHFLHIFVNLLKDAVGKADWGLETLLWMDGGYPAQHGGERPIYH